MVAASAAVLLLFTQALTQETAAAAAIGQMLVGWMVLLGVVEHWMLVLPMPVTLWGWHLRALPPDDRPAVEQPGPCAAGPLGVVSERVSES